MSTTTAYIVCHDVDTGMMLGSVGITLIKDITGEVKGPYTSPADGSVLLVELSIGQWGIRINKTGYCIWLNGGPADTMFIGVGGGTDMQVDVPMKVDAGFTKGNFSVFARNSADNSPIVNARVRINRVDTNPPGYYQEGNTNAEGYYTFTNQYLGTYYIQVTATTYNIGTATRVVSSFPDVVTIYLSKGTTDMYVWVPQDGTATWSYGGSSGSVPEGGQAGPVVVTGGTTFRAQAFPKTDYVFREWVATIGTPGQLLSSPIALANPTNPIIDFRPDVAAYWKATLKATFDRRVSVFPWPFYVEVIHSGTHAHLPGVRVSLNGINSSQLVIGFTGLIEPASFLDPTAWDPQSVLVEKVGYVTKSVSVVNNSLTTITIEMDPVSGTPGFPLPFYATVTDNVTGIALPTATVTIYGANAGEQYTAYTTVSGGAAMFPAGAFTFTPDRITAEKTGYVMRTISLVGYSTNTITIALTLAVTGIKFPFTVTVVDGITAMPVKQASVAMFGADPSNQYYYTFTGINGESAVFSSAPQWIPQFLRVSKTGYVTQSQSLVGYPNQTMLIVLVPLTVSNFKWPFYVTVIDGLSGNSVPNAEVTLIGTNPLDTLTDYTGTPYDDAVFNDPGWIPDTMLVQKAGYASLRRSLAGYTNSSITVYIYASGATTTLTVTCRDSSQIGSPAIENVTITVGEHYGKTNVSGVLTVDLPPGTYTVTAAKTGYLTMRQTVAIGG